MVADVAFTQWSTRTGGDWKERPLHSAGSGLGSVAVSVPATLFGASVAHCDLPLCFARLLDTLHDLGFRTCGASPLPQF